MKKVSRPIRAELIGADTCAGAGFTTKGGAPVLALCRQLLAQGVDPDTAMAVYRAGTVALRVRSLGEAARLEVAGNGVGFRATQAMGTASLVSETELATTQAWAETAAE